MCDDILTEMVFKILVCCTLCISWELGYHITNNHPTKIYQVSWITCLVHWELPIKHRDVEDTIIMMGKLDQWPHAACFEKHENGLP